jgi:hypothetical protein
VGVECGYTNKEDTDDGPSAVADRGLHHPGSRWVCAAYAEDTVLEDGEGNLIAQALDSIRDLYGELFSESSRLHGEVLNRVTVGKYVIDEERVRGMEMEGSPSEVHAAVVYRLVEGKIAHVMLLG